MKLVECVPNFSEGRDKSVIDAISEAIRAVEGVQLLDVDPGRATNRTVFTFVAPPEAAAAAAFAAVRVATLRIDMRRQRGEHPRMGAADVVPFVPLAGTTMDDCVALARQVGRRIGDELAVPVYLYESAASRPERRSLSDIRSGEYEGLAAKLADPAWQPDFGPSAWNERSGATVVGAREFLIAYNVNLNTRDRKLAQEIALTIRETGRAKRDSAGEIVRNADGTPVMVAGTLTAVKAVGWVIEEYGRAQISVNVLDYRRTSLHAVFDECCRVAEAIGVRVTGSEIVGLVPQQALLDAGRHYLRRQGRSTGEPVPRLTECAIQSLGLSDVTPFRPEEKVIERRIAQPARSLRGLTLVQFADEASTDSPAPGGGSVAALCGALCAALAAMVANLTHGRKGHEEDRPEMESLAEEAQQLKDAFLLDVDRDTDAFNAVMTAMRLPRANEADKAARASAIDASMRGATEVPLGVLRRSVDALRLAEAVALRGSRSSLSDAAVAALAGGACAEGAYCNVRINLQSMTGPESGAFIARRSTEAADLLARAEGIAGRTRDFVRAALGGPAVGG